MVREWGRNVSNASLQTALPRSLATSAFCFQSPFTACPDSDGWLLVTLMPSLSQWIFGGTRQTVCACVQARGAPRRLETKAGSEIQGTAELP